MEGRECLEGRSLIDDGTTTYTTGRKKDLRVPPAFDLLVVYRGSMAYLRTDRLLVDGEIDINDESKHALNTRNSSCGPQTSVFFESSCVTCVLDDRGC